MNSLTNLKDFHSKVTWRLLFGVSAITLYFKTNAEDPFNTPKLLILVLLGAYLTGYLFNHFRQNTFWKEPGDRAVHILVILFILALLFATANTNPILQGLIGETQRRNGFLSYLMLIIVFLSAYHFVAQFFIDRLFVTAIITGFIMAVYGFMQINGRDFVQWVNPYNSMIGTLGNPNFASALLAVLAALATFSIFIKTIPTAVKISAVIMTILSIYCILESDSRQGLVTYFFSILFYSTIKSLIRFKKLFVPILIASIGSATLVVMGMLQKGPLTYWLYKDSVSVRGFYWRAALEMFQNNYLTGVGMDRYGNFFKLYREVDYPLRYGYEISSSNAHNTILQIFSTAGIFSGLLYLVILSYVFTSGLLFIKNSNGSNRIYMVSLLSTWIGFQAQSFISIDNIGVSVWGWLLSGSVLGMKKLLKTNDPTNQIRLPKAKGVQINIFQPTISTVAVLASLIVVAPVYRAETDSYWVKSLGNNLTQQNINPLSEYSDRLFNNDFADPNYKFRAALYLYDAGFQSKAISIISDLSFKDPNNLDFLNGLAYLYTQEKRLDQAINMYEKISKLDPWNANNYLTLGSLYVQSEKKLSAEENLLKVISIAPNTDVASKAREILSALE